MCVFSQEKKIVHSMHIQIQKFQLSTSRPKFTGTVRSKVKTYDEVFLKCQSTITVQNIKNICWDLLTGYLCANGMEDHKKEVALLQLSHIHV